MNSQNRVQVRLRAENRKKLEILGDKFEDELGVETLNELLNRIIEINYLLLIDKRNTPIIERLEQLQSAGGKKIKNSGTDSISDSIKLLQKRLDLQTYLTILTYEKISNGEWNPNDVSIMGLSDEVQKLFAVASELVQQDVAEGRVKKHSHLGGNMS